jgi:ubiquinone/menaquinone biosynthesis C-methylase UbiE
VSGAASAASTWDRLASRYGVQERLEVRAIEEALRLADVAAHERLVDLATGTGLLLRRLADRPSRPREVVGVDRSAGMLARVGPLPEGWSTVLADARAVPLPDGWADVVTCSYLLHLLDPPERAAVLAEARRLLRPGGPQRLVVVTDCADDSRLGGRIARDMGLLLARARPRTWGGLSPLDPTADLTAAGFAVTQRVLLPRRGYQSLVLAAH